jgi:hypothetical protein
MGVKKNIKTREQKAVKLVTLSPTYLITSKFTPHEAVIYALFTAKIRTLHVNGINR